MLVAKSACNIMQELQAELEVSLVTGNRAVNSSIDIRKFTQLIRALASDFKVCAGSCNTHTLLHTPGCLSCPLILVE